MRLSDRVKILITAQIVVCLLSVFLLKNGNLPRHIAGAVILALGEAVLLAAAYFFAVRPLRRMEQIASRLAIDENPSEEKLEEAVREEPYLEPLERVVRLYADELTRQTTAEIFDKQTELTALQSQINPHFLYNTLETIRGQALIDGNEQIAVMTEALGAFFRYSISRKGNLVTLREELDNIRNYMLIQQYRFNNRFSLEIIVDEADEEAYDYLIPRLIIQPVVENAIFHGMEDLDEGGVVTIEVMVTDKNLILMISDNGIGIPEDELEALNERIHSRDRNLDEPVGGTHRTGIALPNINRRIQLLFGDEYGVNVYSTLGQGTDVEIMIPADHKRSEDE